MEPRNERSEAVWSGSGLRPRPLRPYKASVRLKWQSVNWYWRENMSLNQNSQDAKAKRKVCRLFYSIYLLFYFHSSLWRNWTCRHLSPAVFLLQMLKPLVERRRRERMNRSLESLRTLLLEGQVNTQHTGGKFSPTATWSGFRSGIIHEFFVFVPGES